MELSTWLEGRGADGRKRSIAGLAAKAKTTRWVIYHLLDGRVPRVETAKRVSKATGGEVSVAELLGISKGAAA